MIKRDIDNVFLSLGEFAEKITFEYDGVRYTDVSAVFTKIKQKDKKAGHAEGFHECDAVIYISGSVLPYMPERGTSFRVLDGIAAGRDFFEEYEIVTSSADGGLYCIELERVDE